MACPYCIKDLQIRAMFNHIRKTHPEELLKNTNRRWIEDAESGKPLRLYWETKNDFDDIDYTTLYACLATNKTFTTEMGARQHLAKDPKILKEHNKHIKQIKKDFQAFHKAEHKRKAEAQKKKAKTDPALIRLNEAKESNSPELARAIWRGILNQETTLKVCMMICKRRGYGETTPMYFLNKKKTPQQDCFDQISFAEFCVAYEQLLQKIQEYKMSRCLDVKKLNALFFEAMMFWRSNFAESMMNLNEDLRVLHPNYNIGGYGDEKFFGFATEEMEGVDF